MAIIFTSFFTFFIKRFSFSNICIFNSKWNTFNQKNKINGHIYLMWSFWVRTFSYFLDFSAFWVSFLTFSPYLDAQYSYVLQITPNTTILSIHGSWISFEMHTLMSWKPDAKARSARNIFHLVIDHPSGFLGQ